MSFPVNSEGKQKYAGRCKAVVTDNKDPQAKGRIKVDHPLFGVTVWIPYLQLPFAFDVPEIGDIVYVEADGGFKSHPVAWGKLPAEGSEVQVPEEFQRIKPTNRGFYTPEGHLIEFDDGDPITALGKGVRITTSDGSKIHITEDPLTDSKITLERKEGAIVELDGIEDKITVKANFGDEFSVSAADGLQGSTPSGTSLSFKNGAINLEASSNKFDMELDGTINIENASGNKVNITPTGEITAENVAGAKLAMTPTEVTAENAAGSKMTLGPTEVSMINPLGAGFKADGPQVAIGGPTAELVDLVVQAFTALSTQTAPGFGAPTSTVAQFAQLLAQAQTIKGSL